MFRSLRLSSTSTMYSYVEPRRTCIFSQTLQIFFFFNFVIDQTHSHVRSTFLPRLFVFNCLTKQSLWCFFFLFSTLFSFWTGNENPKSRLLISTGFLAVFSRAENLSRGSILRLLPLKQHPVFNVNPFHSLSSRNGPLILTLLLFLCQCSWDRWVENVIEFLFPYLLVRASLGWDVVQTWK